jgi:hypothetical protein
VASNIQWLERTVAAYRNFPYAPPHYPGAPYRARLPQPPYDGAEEWKCSVYYYWWEYLRRHEGYRATCVAGGQGEHAELYRRFGNVHEGDFHDWWWSHYQLFTFMSEAQNIVLSKKFYLESEGVFLHVGYARSKSEMIASAREQIMRIPQREINDELRKSIRFKPAVRPVLKSLHQHLLAWDARLEHPNAKDADICDLAGLDVSLPYIVDEIASLQADGLKVADLEKTNRRAKQIAVQRHLRIAKQYIDNVVQGEFPKRDRR